MSANQRTKNTEQRTLRVLVTGGAGFIGSNIVDKYISLGHEVVVVDNLSSGKKSNINPKSEFIEADIRDKQIIKKVFSKHKIDILNHHAAQIDVRKSVKDPAFDADINVIGFLNLMENAVKTGVKKVIFASSGGTIYGECPGKPASESFAPNPLSPYGITKRVTELYLNYYSETYNISKTVLRYGNVYGPRQDPHGEAGVVAIFSEKILDKKELLIFGDGNQTRDYVYIDDVVNANVLALTKAENEVINIGTGKLTSVNGLFKSISEVSGFKSNPVYKPKRTGELFRSYLDISKAKEVLGWEPVIDIGEGLKRTFNYFRENLVSKA